jgi:hypothetical protein
MIDRARRAERHKTFNSPLDDSIYTSSSSSMSVDPRTSIYYLSTLAATLQDALPAQTLGYQSIQNASNNAMFLNTLATCLSRGKISEASLVVAATIGPVKASGVTVSVVARFD